MSSVTDYLKIHPLVYVTRDIERALGLPLETEGYFIISNSTPLAKSLTEGFDNVILIESDEMLSTRQLLSHARTEAFIKSQKNPTILIFKSNGQIEKITHNNRWHLLNPSAAIAALAEQKISQGEWLGEFAHHLPPHNIRLCRDVDWRDEPFILQFNHGHTGIGTALIESEEDLHAMCDQFPNRPARCAEFIPGPIFTNNNVVLDDKTLIGNISYQITGLAPFTDNPFATIGNDWHLPQTLLSDDQRAQYIKIVEDVASRFREDGWNGLFGVDIVADERTGTLYLLEINARQPASATYESALQRAEREAGAAGLTTFEAHIAAVMGIDVEDATLIALSDGAQITQRVTKYKKKIDDDRRGRVHANGFEIIEYNNSKIGKELMLMRSEKGLMADHNILNDIGKELV